MIKAYASGGKGGRPSTSRTADDRAYTAKAQAQAAEAGIRNPVQYVNRNVARNAPVANRNRVLGAIR